MDKKAVTVNIRSPSQIQASMSKPDSVSIGIPNVIMTGGGTTDYNRMRNKPTLNGVEISGDKTSKDYGIATIPTGGNIGDIMTRTSGGAGWIAPASDFHGDNTRPITAAAVNTIVGNIDALLATI